MNKLGLTSIIGTLVIASNSAQTNIPTGNGVESDRTKDDSKNLGGTSARQHSTGNAITVEFGGGAMNTATHKRGRGGIEDLASSDYDAGARISFGIGT